MTSGAIKAEIARLEGELERTRGEIEAATRKLNAAAAAGAPDAELDQRIAERDAQIWAVERDMARLEGLKAKLVEVERQEAKAADLARAQHLEAWHQELIAGSAEIDDLLARLARLAQAFEAREACVKECQHADAIGLRDLERAVMPVNNARAALHHGLDRYLPLAHPWHDAKHRAPLTEIDAALPDVPRVLERLRGDGPKAAA